MQRALTPGNLEAIRTMTAAGATRREIIETLGISRASVSRARAQLRQPPPVSPMGDTPTPGVPDQAEVLRLLGAKARDGNVRARE